MTDKTASQTFFGLLATATALLLLNQTTVAADLGTPTVSTSHQVGGQVRETKDAIIVKGAKFIVDDPNTDISSVIDIPANSKKKVILDGVQIISNKSTFKSSDGDAAPIVIDNTRGSSKVTLHRVQVKLRNSSVSSTSQNTSNCAGAICFKAGRYDSARSASVSVSGQTNITATQGSRPDYRKIQSN